MGQPHELQHSQLDVKPALDRAQARNKEEIDRKRKAFVGGLPRNLPDHELQAYFQQYGPIQKCYVVKDPNTGKTRGFGFVIFGTEDGFDAALRKTDHVIKGKEVHLKSAMSKYDLPAESTSTKGSTSKNKHPPNNLIQESKKNHKNKPHQNHSSSSRNHKSKFNQQPKFDQDPYHSSQSYWNHSYAAKDFNSYGQFGEYEHPYDYENNQYPEEYDFQQQQPGWNGYGYNQDYWNQEFEYPANDYYDYQNQGYHSNMSNPQPGPIGGQRFHSNGKAINSYKEETLADGNNKSPQGYSIPQNAPLIPVQKLHSNSLSDRELYQYHAQSAKISNPKIAQFTGFNQQSSMQEVYFQKEAGLKNDAAFTLGSASNLVSKQAPRSAQAIPLSSHVFSGNQGSIGKDRSAPMYIQNPFEEEEEGALQRAEDIYG